MATFKICAPRIKATDIKTETHGKIKRIADASVDGTPSVDGVTVLLFSGATAGTITNFDDGVDGQILKVLVDDDATAAVTFTHGAATLICPGSADVVMQAGTQITGITFIYDALQTLWLSCAYDV